MDKLLYQKKTDFMSLLFLSRDINDRDREVVRQRGRRVESGTSRSALTDYDQDEQRDREITKLKYMVNRHFKF